MKIKRLFAILLAMGLLFGSVLPVLAIEDDIPGTSTVSQFFDSGEGADPPKETNQPATPDNAEQGDSQTRTEPLTPATDGETDDLSIVTTASAANVELPSKFPAFSAELVDGDNGLQMMGTFTDLPADAIRVRPLYSLDGENFQRIQQENGTGNYDWDLSLSDAARYTQLCADGDAEPLKSYRAGDIDEFWVRLRIVTPDNTYRTQAALVRRPEPPPAEDAPAFSARLVVDGEGYGVLGAIEEFPQNVIRVRPMWSTDGSTYESSSGYFDWTLPGESAGEETPEGAQSQICIRGEDEPLASYLRGEIETFWIKLRVDTADGSTYATKPAQIEHGSALSPPTEPPAFTMEIKRTANGYWLYGTFTDFTPDIQTVLPVYSLDGEFYQPIVDEDGEPEPWDLTRPIYGDSYMEDLTRQLCSSPWEEPFCSYLSGTLDEFWVKLRLTTWSGETYRTQPSRISRELADQPEGTTAEADWPISMCAKDEGRFQPYYGKVQVTAREGMTAAELETLLPNRLSLEIQLLSGLLPMDSGIFSYPVKWMLPEDLALTAEVEPTVIRNATAPPVVPAGEEVSMATGIYRLTEGARYPPNREVRLFVNVLPRDAKANIALGVQDPEGPLFLSFPKKPSGATAIRAFYYYDGLEDWVEAGDLLEQIPVDAKPSNPASEYYTLFTLEQAPYLEYLAGERSGFLVGIEIEGGVFDGELHTLNWPGDYEMPPRVPDFKGSGGNENNAGGESGDSTEDGQRPNLPDDNKPPVQDGSGGGDEPSRPAPLEPISFPPDPEPSQTVPPVENEDLPTEPAQTPQEAGVMSEKPATPSQTLPPAGERPPDAQEILAAEVPSSPQEPSAQERPSVPGVEPPTGQRESISRESEQISAAQVDTPPVQEENPNLPAPVIVGFAAAVMVGGGAVVGTAGVSAAVSGRPGLLAKLGKAILKLLKFKK